MSTQAGIAQLFPIASRIVTEVMRRGAATHPGQDWRALPAGFHLARARRHLALLSAGDTTEPHRAHACARLVMAVECSGYLDYVMQLYLSKFTEQPADRSINYLLDKPIKRPPRKHRRVTQADAARQLITLLSIPTLTRGVHFSGGE